MADVPAFDYGPECKTKICMTTDSASSYRFFHVVIESSVAGVMDSNEANYVIVMRALENRFRSFNLAADHHIKALFYIRPNEKRKLCDLHLELVSHMKDERRINRVLSTNVMVGKSRVICQCDHHYTSVPVVYRKSEPLEIVAFYILDLNSKPNSYFLLVTDYFTRLAEAYGILNQQADAVVEQLVQHFICHLPAWSDCTLTKEHSYKAAC
ncbi:hypothetical protein T11_3213 [Trichinella zimbabwensis]|uniref:Integrase catalytic domain-containing protein n=1 Tax=Trichinella zimbabwensis TaxID=268475 RepID=A0A0V1H1Y2_9BILA|nr:hypothetical protein T11_3213 [Trichinella zimbabwensis]